MSETTNDTANAGDNAQASTAGGSFSQEDVNRIVQERLVREREKFQGFDEYRAAAERLAAVEAEKNTLAEQVAAFAAERDRAALVAEVAKDAEVPADALRGATREELEAHAAVLKTLLKPTGPVIPGQEKTPSSVSADPLKVFAKGLFDKAKNE